MVRKIRFKQRGMRKCKKVRKAESEQTGAGLHRQLGTSECVASRSAKVRSLNLFISLMPAVVKVSYSHTFCSLYAVRRPHAL
jgi:hypothetical protein